MVDIVPVEFIEGYAIPKVFELEIKRPMKEHLGLLRELEVRDDDVLVVACAKAGTHWIWEVTYMLLLGQAKYQPNTKEFAMLEASEIENIQRQPSPRLLNTHLPWSLLPRQLTEKKVKVIHVYRNVKDVFVSLFFMMRQMPGFASTLTLEDLEEHFFSERALCGNYFNYLQQMETFRKKNPHVPFFNISYEDMKSDPVSAVSRLAEFLGVAASPELVDDIVQATSFSKMKEADSSKQRTNLPPVRMYRKGDVGDWKNYLTIAQSERFDTAMSQFQPRDYHFRYTL